MKRFSTFFVALCLCLRVWAGEGMWLPIFLGQLNEAEMRSMGLKLTAEDIYSINKGSLKDAIVSFGGFCTAEVISSQGLILTNHHCGYDAIQEHSTLEHNYLETGFWAMNRAEELANPGLTATFIIRIEEVTEAALVGITEGITEKDRASTIAANLKKIQASAKKEAWEEAVIRPFFEGNRYFLFVTETYKDVRLVGAPPSSIGKFGSDTDNWVWPRHTGDFSMFRIYAGADGHPAEYSTSNVPMVPRHSLPISLDGVAEGDFTMVMGFPGRTQAYLPSQAVTQTVETLNPTRIEIRDKTLKIMDVAMRSDAQTKIQLSSNYATIANAWKKWIGESQGLKATDGVGKKLRFEADFQQRLSKDTKLNTQYGDILPAFGQVYTDLAPIAKLRDTYREVFSNCKMMQLGSMVTSLAKEFDTKGEAGYNDRVARVKDGLPAFYKEFVVGVDRDIFAALMEIYARNFGDNNLPELVKANIKKAKSFHNLADNFYGKSFLLNEKALTEILSLPPAKAVKALRKDPAFRFIEALMQDYSANIDPKLADINAKLIPLQRRYMAAQIAAFPERKFFPDANSTLRVAYGKVNGFEPRDGACYTPYTYLDGVMAKYVPGDYEFDVPAKLRKLYADKDFGQYATAEGKVPVCFIASNHTTGGNSGSPAIDANGNLIGLNFDRVWEGTMSDINYDPSICRNIMVDARYVLFIVDKYAGASHLIKEMTLVHPKAK